MARRHLGKKDSKGIAAERIDILFGLAEKEALEGRHERAKRYVSLALRMGERHKVPASHKRRYCPSCLGFFVPPTNVRVRTGKGRISFTCLSCGHISRFPLAPRRRSVQTRTRR